MLKIVQIACCASFDIIVGPPMGPTSTLNTRMASYILINIPEITVNVIKPIIR